jgi:RNA polymerase sigma-70 factor (ECF subfamily)
MKSLDDETLQRAYRYAMSLSNDHDLAKDLVHSAYVKVLEKHTGHVDNLHYYFLRTIRNVFIDHMRLDKRWSMIVDDDEEAKNNTVDMTVDTLESITINQNILATLWLEFTAEERELLYLWAIEEYTMKEISELTDIPRGTLLSRVHRIRKKVASKNISEGIEYEQTH